MNVAGTIALCGEKEMTNPPLFTPLSINYIHNFIHYFLEISLFLLISNYGSRISSRVLLEYAAGDGIKARANSVW